MKGLIIPAAGQDWEIIKNMFVESFADDIFFSLMKRRLNLAQTAARVSKTLADLFAGKAYIAWEDERPQGFMLINVTGKTQMHLNYMAVLPEFRGQGLGRELTRLALKLADEHRADISLETQADSPAMRLYSKLGFRAVNKIHIYSLAAPLSSFAETGMGSELTAVQTEKSLRQVLKEWVFGVKTFDLVYKPQAEKPLVFHVCQPTAGGEGIIHCRINNNANEVLLQALPLLFAKVNNNRITYLVVTGPDQGHIESPWVGEHLEYIRMIKKEDD